MRTIKNENTEIKKVYSNSGNFETWKCQTIGMSSGFIYEEWTESRNRETLKITESKIERFQPSITFKKVIETFKWFSDELEILFPEMGEEELEDINMDGASRLYWETECRKAGLTPVFKDFS